MALRVRMESIECEKALFTSILGPTDAVEVGIHRRDEYSIGFRSDIGIHVIQKRFQRLEIRSAAVGKPGVAILVDLYKGVVDIHRSYDCRAGFAQRQDARDDPIPVR